MEKKRKSNSWHGLKVRLGVWIYWWEWRWWERQSSNHWHTAVTDWSCGHNFFYLILVRILLDTLSWQYEFYEYRFWEYRSPGLLTRIPELSSLLLEKNNNILFNILHSKPLLPLSALWRMSYFLFDEIKYIILRC